VRFRNVPSFLLERDLVVAVEGLGRITLDLGYGGAFYAYVDAAELGLRVEPAQVGRLIDVGRRIKRAVAASYDIRHPAGDADLNFLYGTVLFERASAEHPSRNVCVFADGEVDRSPTGTGVSGRAASLHARGELALGEPLAIESIIGTSFRVSAAEEVQVGTLRGIVPEVTGSAYVTGRHEFFVGAHDPLSGGFLLR